MEKKLNPWVCNNHALKKTFLIMRWSLFFLFVGVIQSQAISSYAQKTQLSLNFYDVTVATVLDEVEDMSGFYFLCNRKLVDLDRKVSIQVNDQTIDKILDEIFEGTDVYYVIQDKQIVLASGARKETTESSLSPQSVVTGTVTDTNGIPLPGVAIVIKGTTTGTITNFDGEFSLTDVSEDAILQFSFVGMKPAEIQLTGQTVINITLEEETIGLEEVVAVGYGVQKKATLTGAIASVDADKIVQRPAANTSELLQGQLAGLVTRQTSGLPGSDGATINIRGFSNNPLVLIDGIESDINQVDPNDIASVSVLKDAAAAVYGARAGNGVILVTTKRGSETQSKINYHGSVSFTQPTFLADVVGATQWAELLTESGLDPNNYSPDYLYYDSATKKFTRLVDGSEFTGYDWSKAVYRNWTPQHQHNINASGGTEKIKYFVSAGFTDQASNFKSGDYNFNRYNIRSNIDAEINDYLGVSVDFSYRTTLLDKANFTVSDIFNDVNHAKPVYPYEIEADPTRATYTGAYNSPYFQTFKEYSGFVENRENVINGAIALNYTSQKIEGLSAVAKLNFENIYSWDKNVRKPFTVWEYDELAASNGNDPWIDHGVIGRSYMSVYADRISELLPQFSLIYEKNVGGHNFKGMVVGEAWTYKVTTLEGSRNDLLSYEAPYLDYASEDGQDNSETASERARISVISRLNYDYEGKYILGFTLRADASAEYPEDSRWGYFPSFSAGWRISEESFLKDNCDWLDNLKLRASYGILGNDAVSSFDYLTGYTIPGTYYVFGSSAASVIASAGLANPNITWETMKISNVGIDGNLWRGKLGFELDVFYRLRENILAVPVENVPTTFGASLPRTNLNSMDNRGFELTLSHNGNIGAFSYSISPRISWSRGKYVDIDENVLPVSGEDLDEETIENNELWNSIYVTEGQWDDEIWGYASDGLFQNQEEIDNYGIDQDQNGNQTLKVGDIKYKDLNGDNYIDWRDQQVIGKSGMPNTMYSLDLGIRYKNFSLQMLWQGGAGYSVTFTGEAAAPFSNESMPLDIHYENRAIVGTDSNGDEYITNPGNANLPPVSQTGLNSNNSKSSDFWTYDARYLRLKNLNISYSLPKDILGKTGIDNCVVYLSGTNMFTLSNLGIWKNSFDPEITTQSNRNYPPVKTLTFGLRLTL